MKTIRKAIPTKANATATSTARAGTNAPSSPPRIVRRTTKQ
jgi:hypothetical protein